MNIENNMNINNILIEAGNALNQIKKENPLTHCITNSVTVNDCANAILAIGGSPIMAHNEKESEDIINIAKSLVINIGNPNQEDINAIKKSCKHANKQKIPITFDPVGVGISEFRNNLSLEIIKKYKPNIIRGNMSEIKAIVNLIDLDYYPLNSKNVGKGVDVNINDITTEENLKQNGIIIKELSKSLNSVIVSSGEIDLISNGDTTLAIKNGDNLMPKITGSGCMLSTIIGSYIGANKDLIGSITGSLHMTIAGEKAGNYTKEKRLGLGTFRQKLIDELYLLKSEDIIKNAKIEIIR